ncbi:hypothetical protein [Burkholderia cepacia]|uniref:hypothetical protein n=1 Tax=Burkholderia cepacia TaxID=292 RepID=UPI002AB4B2D7|nr:hypothetical protein [Burkholderia cepacia]HEM8511376.1 hypothetical protein [Burkholderia cepacia]
MSFGEGCWLLKVAGYNELVGNIPRYAWVDTQSPDVLQGLLDARDVASFALSSKLSPEDREMVNETTPDFAAARWAHS